jgi:hypothetical protein
MPVIGYLHYGSLGPSPEIDAFRPDADLEEKLEPRVA